MFGVINMKSKAIFLEADRKLVPIRKRNLVFGVFIYSFGIFMCETFFEQLAMVNLVMSMRRRNRATVFFPTIQAE